MTTPSPLTITDTYILERYLDFNVVPLKDILKVCNIINEKLVNIPHIFELKTEREFYTGIYELQLVVKLSDYESFDMNMLDFKESDDLFAKYNILVTTDFEII